MYKENHIHDSLFKYFTYLNTSGEYKLGSRLIVYTYTNILFNL